jgi:hypothetical protein
MLPSGEEAAEAFYRVIDAAYGKTFALHFIFMAYCTFLA